MRRTLAILSCKQSEDKARCHQQQETAERDLQRPARQAVRQRHPEAGGQERHRNCQRKSHRGFYAASISIADLEELVKTRIWLETLALRESMGNGDETWEEELVVSCHRLTRIQRRLPEDAQLEIYEQWEERHKEFHMLLLDRCGSAWLLGFCSTLMDQAVRYRNLSMNTNPSKQRREGAAAEHQAILDAVLDQDVELACERLAEHYRITLEGLKAVILPEGETKSARSRHI